MKKVFFISWTASFLIFICGYFPASAVQKTSPGEDAFIKNCAVCHANGGNTINPAKNLKRKSLVANGIRKPADIISKMRNPGPGMTRFDEKDIPEKTARQIADYIMKTFR